MDVSFYKEQLQAKEDMLARTTNFLSEIQLSLTQKNKELFSVQKDILDSVSFAKMIQTSLLPDANLLKIFFKDAGYKVAQQIGIGGDTVFIKSTGEGVVFCLLDATGHGIPAAMLSISGTLILNEITSSIEIDNPSTLLKLLNYRLYKTFNNNNLSIAHFEGIAFYYSAKHNLLSYSSAKGKAFLIDGNGNITSLFNSKKSIGEDPAFEFEVFNVAVKKGEKLLFFSDGLIDQFGGEKDKKFTSSRLKKVVSENYNKSVTELIEIIFTAIQNWKGTNKQTDDISFKLIEF